MHCHIYHCSLITSALLILLITPTSSRPLLTPYFHRLRNPLHNLRQEQQPQESTAVTPTSTPTSGQQQSPSPTPEASPEADDDAGASPPAVPSPTPSQGPIIFVGPSLRSRWFFWSAIFLLLILFTAFIWQRSRGRRTGPGGMNRGMRMGGLGMGIMGMRRRRGRGFGRGFGRWGYGGHGDEEWWESDVGEEDMYELGGIGDDGGGFDGDSGGGDGGGGDGGGGGGGGD